MSRQPTAKMKAMGRVMIVAGAMLIVLGLLFEFGGRLPLRLGHLPGDIVIRWKSGSVYFPLATCLVLSVVLSFLMWLAKR